MNPNSHENPYGTGPSYPSQPGTGPGSGASQPPSGPNPGYNPYPTPMPPPQSDPYSVYGPNSQYAPPPPSPSTGSNPYAPDDPYAPTMMSQGTSQSYPGYQQPAPAAPPAYPASYPGYQQPGGPGLLPPVNQPPRQRSRSMGILIAVIALLVIVGGIFGVVLFNNHQTAVAHDNATATVQALSTTQAVATAGAQATMTAVASTYPFSNNLVLNDPLTDSSHSSQYGWDDSGSHCFFSAGAYHAFSDKSNTFYTCAATRENFINFTLQVQMTIKTGGTAAEGGLIFRGNENNAQFYVLFIDTRGNYELDISVNSDGANDRTLQKGTISGFHSGLNQVHTLAVVANGPQITLYVDQNEVTEATDSTYSSGQIGFIGTYGTSNADVAYNNAKVWQLP